VPVIASNWTASAELVGDVWTPERMGPQRHPSGWLVGVDPDYDFRQIGDWGKPVIGHIIAALEEAHAKRGDQDMRAPRSPRPRATGPTSCSTALAPLLAEMEPHSARPTGLAAGRAKARSRAVA
jgi:hypothetical protein